MKEKFKIFFAWTMLTLLGYNMGGYFMVFEFSENLNSGFLHELISNADESDLQLLVIPDISLITRDGIDEIIVNHKHYDVKEEFTSNDTTYIYCVHDKTEDELYSSLNTVINNSENSGNNCNSHKFDFLKLLVKDYFSNATFLNIPGKIIEKNTPHLNENFLYSAFLGSPTPPPKQLFS